ncbi:unnamed protein product [Chrysoparadoxa australica]
MSTINPPILTELRRMQSAIPRTATVIAVHGVDEGHASNRREVLVAYRAGVAFDLQPTGSRQKLRAKGSAWLTSERMIFVSDSGSSTSLEGLDIPLHCVRDPSFRQPIFGSNNLSGKVVPSDEQPSGATAGEWHLYFRHGGFGTFVPVFYAAVKRARRAHMVVASASVMDSAFVTASAFEGSDQEWANLAASEIVQAIPLDASDQTSIMRPAGSRAPTATPVYDV